MIPWMSILSAASFWGGLGLALVGSYGFIKNILGINQKSAKSALLILLGGTLLALANALSPEKAHGIPIVWPVLAVQMWISAVCAIAAVVNLLQIILVADKLTKGRRLSSATGWTVAAALCWLLPRGNPVPITVLTGVIELRSEGILAITLIAIGTMIAMVQAAKSSRSKLLFKSMSNL